MRVLARTTDGKRTRELLVAFDRDDVEYLASEFAAHADGFDRDLAAAAAEFLGWMAEPDPNEGLYLDPSDIDAGAAGRHTDHDSAVPGAGGRVMGFLPVSPVGRKFVQDVFARAGRVEMTASRGVTVRRELDRLEQGPRVAYSFDPRASMEAIKWNRR